MADKMLELKKEFSRKSKVLENAKVTLKKEFVGIDGIIDEVIENVRSWYVLAEIQTKPTVINLWGLTGTGKTSLVKRLMELIEFSERTYRFDLGEKEGKRSFSSALSDLCDNPDDSPVAIILDEIQHSRTIKGPYREEIENDQNRMIWELIDSGNVSHVEWKSSLWSLERLVQKLIDLLSAGVRVKNGKVIYNKKLFINELNIEKEDTNQLYFIQEYNYCDIIDLSNRKLGFSLQRDLKAHLLTLDGHETVKFLKKVINVGTQPSIKRFHKSIIFVLGNIDEAYSMSGNYNSDISADEFHEMSLKITIPDIKQALRNRFRDEQIARLGNIHIIYPAFSKATYLKIIHLDLERIKYTIKEHLAISLAFEDSLVNEIYKEGVYPTQGARPLFTTIHQMVKSKLSVNISVLLEKQLAVDNMVLSVADEQLVCKFYQSGELLHTHYEGITYNLEKLRKPKKDEEQAITAVHEAGHAVLSIALLKRVPDIVVSVTTESHSMGFMYSKNDKNYTSRKEVLPKTAMFLGGLVAEELVFGENYITGGSGSDIKQATNFLMQLYKKEGFGAIPINHGLTDSCPKFVYHQLNDIEDEVKTILEKAKVLAQEELVKHKELLLAIAAQLAEEPKLEKTQLEALVAAHSSIDLTPTQTDNYYRKTLKEKIKTKQIYLATLQSYPLVLNKGVENNG